MRASAVESYGRATLTFVNKVIESEDPEVQELLRGVNALPADDRREAIQMLVEIVGTSAARSEPLTATEIAALDAMGERPVQTRDRLAVHARHHTAWYDLLASCLTGREEAADRLGVAPTRISQLLGSHRMYCFEADGQARFPTWQFVNGRPLPGIDAIHQWLQRAHPLVVDAWMKTPHDHLTISADGQIGSPVQWLTSGGVPAEVAVIAQSDLG